MYSRLSLRTQIKIGPQLVLGSKLLRASGAEIEQLISHELADNPALELTHEVQPAAWEPGQLGSMDKQPGKQYAYVLSGTGSSRANEDVADRAVACHSALDQLLAQLGLMLDAKELEVAEDLLGSLDGHGYLQAEPEELAEELGVPRIVVERVIQSLHELEPPGIGARDVRECLLIQCRHLEAEGYPCSLTRRIIAEAWDDFVNRRWGRVGRKLGMSGAAIQDAWDFVVRNLYPYPLLLVEDTSDYGPAYLIPDLIIHRQGADYYLEIPESEQFELRISKLFAAAFGARGDDADSLPASERDWIEGYLERARVFIASLEGRWRTLRQIGEFVIEYQRGFLEHGPLQLKPLTRAAVAAELALHESTVSRAIQDKTVQLPDGRLASMSDFFDQSLPLKESIRQVLAAAQRPLSDREIAECLREKDMHVARRTVAKYRAQLAPAGYSRRETDCPEGLARSA